MGKEKTQFKPGNPGRPKGSRNKVALGRREDLARWIDDNFVRFTEEMKKVTGKNFAEIYLKSREFVQPKYASISMSLRNMDEGDLEYLLQQLKERYGNESTE